METSHLFITAGNSADGHINILRNINLFCYKICLVLNFSSAYCLSLMRFAVEDKICFVGEAYTFVQTTDHFHKRF